MLELVLVIVDSEKVAKEECLVLPNGAADVPTVVVVHTRLFGSDGGVLEEGHRCQRADSVDLVRSAMELVCTRLQNHVCHRPVSTP